MQMKKVLILLSLQLSLCACSETSFDVFCDKFPLLSYPIISDPYERGNFFYFQLDRETTITEIEFANYIQTTRWNEFQKPTDSLLHIYHYVPAGRFDFGQYRVLIVNCGYMPEPKKYEDSDIGAYENLLCVYTQDGQRMDSIIISKATCVSNKNGKFAAKWDASMPMIFDKATISADGEIIIQRFKDNEQKPYCIDTLQIDEQTGKIVKK